MSDILLDESPEIEDGDVSSGKASIWFDETSGTLKTKRGSTKEVLSYGDTKKTQISSNDTTEKYLEDAIVAGTNVIVTTLNDGANETLEISTNITSVDDSTVQITDGIGNPIHIDTQKELNNHMFSSGIVGDCQLTDNADGTVSIAAGYALLRTSASTHVNLIPIEVNAQGPLTLTDNTTNYVLLDYNAGSPQFTVSTSESAFNCLDICIAYVVHREGNNLHVIDVTDQTVDSGRKTRVLFRDFSRFIHQENGSVIGDAGTRYLSVTSGAFYYMTTKIEHLAFDTSIAGTANDNVYRYNYRNGVGGWTEVINSKQIDNSRYDNGTGTLATMAVNKFRIDDVYILNNDPSELSVVYGQVEYNSLAEAEASDIPSSRPNLVTGMGSLIGRVVVKNGDTELSSILSSFAVQFASSVPTTHNLLAGLDGGAVGEYYHMTNSEHTIATQPASSIASGYVNTSAQNIAGTKTFDDDIIVTGNFTVNGTTTTVNTEVTTTDNQIILNNGEAGAGVTSGKAGLEIDRGSLTNYEIIFDETDDSFKLGETGSLQKVATREDAPIDGGITFYDQATNKLVTTTDAVYDGTNFNVTSFTMDQGSLGALPFSFTGDSDTGMYSQGGNQMSFVAAGAWKINISTSQLQKSVPIRSENGTVTTPGYSFTGMTDGGLYRDSVSDSLRMAVNGNDVFTFHANLNIGAGILTPTSKLHVAGSFATAIETVTGATTLDGTHYTLLSDATTASFAVTLPIASSCSGRIYNIKKIDSTSNTVTIDGDGTETIDGSLTQIINIQYDSITIQSNGTNWYII